MNLESEKKYKCLFDLTDNCEARKFVEETSPQIDLTQIIKKAEVSLPKFDDQQVAFDIGEAVGRGLSESLKPLLNEAGGHETIREMAGFCTLCPTRIKEVQKRSYP